MMAFLPILPPGRFVMSTHLKSNREKHSFAGAQTQPDAQTHFKTAIIQRHRLCTCFVTPSVFVSPPLVFVPAYSPEVKCRCALICCTRAFTLQPIFSPDDYYALL